MISCVHSEANGKIKSNIAGLQVSVIFNGTTTVCEAMVVILRFVDDPWNICQRAILLSKSLTGEEVARKLISTLLAIPSIYYLLL